MDAKQTLDFYTPEQRMGLICQRGGQELALTKSIDRFTVCFDDSSTNVGMVLPIKEQKSILGSSLQELQVNPIHLAPAMQEIRQQSNVKFVSHVYFFEASPHNPVYLTDEIMVQYQSEEEERRGWENDHGLELLKPILEIPHTYIYRVGESATQNPLKIVNQLKAHAGILRAEVNIIAERRTFSLGGDALSIEDWYHNALPEAGEGDQAHIHLRDAWQMTKGDSKVALAIADLSFSYQGATNLLGEVAVGSLTGVAPECELVPLPSPQYFDDGAIEEFFDLATAREASVIFM
ncbi:MAG: hypothetical protein HC796_06795 [Synechococcaceae cyanobacterium RL_1_2]|nr:hypothetical protein [Synechococcaceae cyanobacterium RL_1_2]